MKRVVNAACEIERLTKIPMRFSIGAAIALQTTQAAERDTDAQLVSDGAANQQAFL